jgi:hypothetical protein
MSIDGVARVNTETSRRCGIVFETTTIDRSAHQCATLAAKWGGLAMVFCDPLGTIDVMIPGTLDAMRATRSRPLDLVGTYDVNRKSIRSGRELIARDIWQHMLDMASESTSQGQSIRAQWMLSEAA